MSMGQNSLMHVPFRVHPDADSLPMYVNGISCESINFAWASSSAVDSNLAMRIPIGYRCPT